MSEELKAAQARIACLEGEIASRDIEIERVTANCNFLDDQNDQLRAELAAIKAQEPVAYISGCYRDVIGGKSDRTPLGAELAFVNMGWIGQIPLYAAPVPEAKAQGVIDFVFSGELPNATFVEVEDGNGNSINVGEWFKRDDGYSVLRLTAAPAAPAADAGIVDMYRHLQKVTPYRFKKIQDASITDGGDVMYFHKDRFDAALLADMAAHCAAKGVV